MRATKDWKTSTVYRDIDKLVRTWLPRLKEHSPWQFSENDPLPSIYDETLQWAPVYEARARAYPNVWHTEFGFEEHATSTSPIGGRLGGCDIRVVIEFGCVEHC